MKTLFLSALLATFALPALADIQKVSATGSVAEVTDALEAAVTGAGATVFARVDHAAGAMRVGMALDNAQLLIFGNPKLGTPAIQQDPLAGLYLPLRVLVYSVDGATWLAYEDPADMFDGLGVDPTSDVVGKMQGALKKLTAAAAN